MRIAFLLLFISTLVFAEKAGLKLEDVTAGGDTSITIKKGAAGSCVQYEILNGNDDVFGDPEYDRSKAYQSWKTACGQWKASVKEMNKENQVITLNCNTPTPTKDGQTWVFKSAGSFRIKVKTAEAVK